MSTSTFALDGTSYTFLGWGTHTPLYEKGYPLNHSANSMNTTNFDALCAELSLFTWMRILISGGDLYRENNARTRNNFAQKQASYFGRMNRLAGPFRFMCTPYALPGIVNPVGIQSYQITNSGLIQPDVLLADNDTTWQYWLDSIADQISKLFMVGVGLEFFCHGSEFNAPALTNFWQVYVDTSTKAKNVVKKVWLGTGLTGGGLKARFPQLRLIWDDVGATFAGSAAADGIVAPEITYWGAHNYGEGFSDGGSAPVSGNEVITEYGNTTGTALASLTVADLKGICHSHHDMISYKRARIGNIWTSLRDTLTSGYVVKPLFDLNTSSGTYAATAFWYVAKPYVMATGRGDSTCLRPSSGTSGADANFDPAAGVYINVVKRGTDNKWCVVYANMSGSDRTGDVVAFTLGGSPTDLSGVIRDFDCLGKSQGSTSAASTTAGSYTLDTVTNGHIRLLELS